MPARILAIDDDPAVLRAYQRVLSPPHEVVTACGGVEGLTKIVDVRSFDIVLCDLMMPEVDGTMIHDAIRKTAPDRLPFLVFCSGGGAFDERVQAFVAGVDNTFLEKPASRQALLDVINRLTVTPRE